MGVPQYGTDTRSDLANTGQVYDQANNSTSESTLASNNRGTEGAKGLLTPDAGFNQQAGMTPMSEAIQSKFQRTYGVQNQALQHQEARQADAQYFDKVAHAQDMVTQEMKMNYQKRMEKYQQDLARKRARGAVVGQVLGVVGAVVGGVVAGVYSGGTAAAAGATAGYAGGQALGNAIGGS